MVKKCYFLLLIVMSSLVFFGCSSIATGGDEPIKIRIGHSSPATNDRLQNSLIEFKENVEERTNGGIEIELYPASQLGGEREQLEGVQLGSLEMAALSSGPFPGFFETMMIFDLPFIFKNEKIADEVLDGPFGDLVLEKLLEDTGVKGLAWGENGVRHFTNSVRPIEKPEDLNGLSIRTQENPAHMATIEALGGSPTPMAFSEVYGALQQNVIDGQENPISLIQSMRFYEVNNYLTLDGHFYSAFILVINDELYQELPKRFQEVIEDESKKWSTLQRQLNREQVESGMKFLKEQGMNITELTDEEKTVFQEATMPVINEYREMLGDDLIDGLLKAVAESEEKLNK